MACSTASRVVSRMRPLPVRTLEAVITDTPARSVVEQLLALNVHHLFVSDAAGIIVGVISPVDVLRKLG